METVDTVGLLIPVTYFVFLATERLWPARTFPPRSGWQWIGLGFLVTVMTLSTVIPLLIREDWLARHRLIDGTGLGVVGGTLVGIAVLEGVIYAWHRSVHNVDFLWRGFHQMHHSPQRVDIPGSLIFHPTEIVAGVRLRQRAPVRSRQPWRETPSPGELAPAHARFKSRRHAVAGRSRWRRATVERACHLRLAREQRADQPPSCVKRRFAG